MKTETLAAVVLVLAFVAHAPAQTPALRAAPTAPAAALSLPADDTARILAGLPPAPGSPLAAIATDRAWVQHSNFFDAAWTELDKHHLSKIRAWNAAFNPDASASRDTLFYMFSGPDYLYADAFFPNASTYVLCGIEPVGSLPDITRIRPGALPGVLEDLHKSLNSVMSFSFFITKDMKTDLEKDELSGTLPILYIFLARSGKTLREVTFVGIDPDGVLQAADRSSENRKTLTPGVKITFTATNATEPQTLYYFSSDLSDDGIRHSGGFLRFCQSLGTGNSFVKSASYLMHEGFFSTIRTFLLEHTATLVQDDSGIPAKYFTPGQWNVRLFGSYPGPIEIFKKYAQPDLALLYHDSHPVPLDFGIGYRHYARESNLLVATHKPQFAAPANPAAAPQ